MSANIVTFTTKMRKETRKMHSVSDALVNAKFAISLRDSTVWGKGLFVFYHVFAYLEDAKERLNIPEMNMLYVNKMLYRKKAFESDIRHYLGDEWKSIPKSQALENYLEHLEDLEKENPMLLMAYVYHLYMGLLSGGQILAKKKNVMGSKTDTYIDQVIDFGETDLNQLKKEVREAMNMIADKMTDQEQKAFIDESNQVFLMNNLIVNAIEGQNQVIYNMLYTFSAVVLVFLGAVIAYKMNK